MFLESLTGRDGDSSYFGVDVKCISKQTTDFKLYKLIAGFIFMPPLIGDRLDTIVHEFGHAFAVKMFTSFQPKIELSVSPLWQNISGQSKTIFKPPGYDPFTEPGLNVAIAAAGPLVATIYSLSNVLFAVGVRRFSPMTACLIAYSVLFNMLQESYNASSSRNLKAPDYWNMALFGGRRSKEQIADVIKGLNMLGMIAAIAFVFRPGIPKIPGELRAAQNAALKCINLIKTKIFTQKN